MNNVSSDTLFHFTTWENLSSILENGFYPSYSLEYVSLFSKNPEVRIPMVSFCDIPLSQISTHVERYGCYGIGLTKKWGMNEGLNPVMYIRENSDLYHHIANSLSVLKAFRYVMPMVREEIKAVVKAITNPPSNQDELLKTKKREEDLDDYLANVDESKNALTWNYNVYETV